ncbi:MAG: tetratricopeptide repeat protein, partial [Prevotellaceae bacterium]|nr:tetratricopeptide repeat protein [Prevotellaceae bacterium]
MKKIIIICLTALLACNMNAQTNVDSLVNVLETQKLTAKEQLELYEKICEIYRNNDLKKFIFYTNKGLQLAEKENSKEMICDFYRYVGDGYNLYGKYDTAIIYYEKALALAVETADRECEATIYRSLGSIYITNNSNVAIEYYLKALNIAESISDKKNISLTFSNIAEYHRILRNHERAVYYAEKAKTIAEEINYDYGKICAYYTLGDIEADIDKSIDYNFKMVEIARRIGDKNAESFGLQALGYDYCLGKHEYDKAEKYALDCLQVAEEYGATSSFAAAFTVLSFVYLYQKRYEECKDAVLKAWAIDSFDMQLSTLTNLAAAYLYMGDLDSAHSFFVRYVYRIEELSNKQFQEALAETEIKYETEKKELRIAALEKEKTLYTWIIIVSAVAALFAFGILFYRHKLNIQKRKQAEQQIKQLEQEKQLIATQALIDG